MDNHSHQRGQAFHSRESATSTTLLSAGRADPALISALTIFAGSFINEQMLSLGAAGFDRHCTLYLIFEEREAVAPIPELMGTKPPLTQLGGRAGNRARPGHNPSPQLWEMRKPHKHRAPPRSLRDGGAGLRPSPVERTPPNRRAEFCSRRCVQLLGERV